MRFKRFGDEMVAVDDDEAWRDGSLASFVREGDEVPVERRDFRDGEKPLTAEQRRAVIAQGDAELEKRKREYAANFRAFLLHGKDGLDSRAQAEGTDSAGGYIVPEGFSRQLIAGVKAHDGLLDAATVVLSDTGSEFPIPVDADVDNDAAIVAESGASTPRDAVFDSVQFGKAPQWRSGIVRASFEVVGDAGFDFQAMLATLFSRRFSRGLGSAFVSTLLTQATQGKVAASGTQVTGDELLDLMLAVDSGSGENGGWLMNFTVFTTLRKLKGSTSGDFLLPIGRNSVGRPTLFDAPVYLSRSMPAMTSGLKPILFGDMSRFLFRQVRGSLTIRNYRERFAEFAQVGFESFWRCDGALAKSSNAVPVKYLTMA